MQLEVIGAKPVTVSDAVFGKEFREGLVHQVVVAYRNAGRAGTKKQKSRSDMSGTTKKFKKQKGGGARHETACRTKGRPISPVQVALTATRRCASPTAPLPVSHYRSACRSSSVAGAESLPAAAAAGVPDLRQALGAFGGSLRPRCAARASASWRALLPAPKTTLRTR